MSFPLTATMKKAQNYYFPLFKPFFLSLPENKKATFRDWEYLHKQLHEKEKELAFIEGIKCGVRFILESVKNQ